jgi:hypothetical protein
MDAAAGSITALAPNHDFSCVSGAVYEVSRAVPREVVADLVGHADDLDLPSFVSRARTSTHHVNIGIQRPGEKLSRHSTEITPSRDLSSSNTSQLLNV